MNKTLSTFFYLSFTICVIDGCAATNSNTASSAVTVNSQISSRDTAPDSSNSSSLSNSGSGTEITLKRIMSDPDWLGRQPERAGWSVATNELTYLRKQQGSPVKALYRAAVSDPENATLVPDNLKHLYVSDESVRSLDGKWLAWTYEDSVLLKYQNDTPVILRQGLEYRDLTWSVDNQLLVQLQNEVIKINPTNGAESVVFKWSFADKPSAVSPPKDYIAEQQISLIRTIQKKRGDRQTLANARQTEQSQNNAYSGAPIYFKKDHELIATSISPALNYALVITQEQKDYRSDSDIMPAYVRENGRIETLSVRQRVADATPDNHEIWLINLETMEKSQLSFNELAGYNDDVLAQVKLENAQAKGEGYQNNRLPRPITLLSSWSSNKPPIKWHSKGTQVAIMLEAYDNKDRWLTIVDFASKKLVTQNRLNDDAWINYAFNQFGWLHNEDTLFYLSEETGYSQLYIKPIAQQSRALTQGNYVIDNVTVTQDDTFIYYTANQKHPGIYEVYRVNTHTGESTELTHLNGMSSYSLSPDESQLLITHSSLTQPPELYLKAANPKTPAERITHTISDEFNALPWTKPKIVAIDSSHTDKPIYSRVYLPKDYQAGEPNKAVVFNHGAGYLQNAHMGWSGYFREFMFHSMLVQKGYVVLDMDYRASKGYGRDWRTAIYRNMGEPELQDLDDGVNWLVNNANVDRTRIGTYGGSYGGFLTFMAMFKQPDLFASGAALRPVTDWAHYNAPYTSNILNTPDIDPIAYQRSSPIYFADGLRKPLLINAPMVDNNVFFGGVVRLVQRLIELEKTPLFETAIYPVEAHGFVQPSSWLDEYTRIYELFEETL